MTKLTLSRLASLLFRACDDLRTNKHFTLTTNLLQRVDLDEFVKCYTAKKLKPTWSEGKYGWPLAFV